MNGFVLVFSSLRSRAQGSFWRKHLYSSNRCPMTGVHLKLHLLISRALNRLISFFGNQRDGEAKTSQQSRMAEPDRPAGTQWIKWRCFLRTTRIIPKNLLSTSQGTGGKSSGCCSWAVYPDPAWTRPNHAIATRGSFALPGQPIAVACWLQSELAG